MLEMTEMLLDIGVDFSFQWFSILLDVQQLTPGLTHFNQPLTKWPTEGQSEMILVICSECCVNHSFRYSTIKTLRNLLAIPMLKSD